MISIFGRKKEYENAGKKHKSGLFEVDKWLISEFVLNSLIPVVGYTPFPLDELMFITSAVCWYSPDYIFEWGTHYGKSARIFYEILKAFRLKYSIFTIDLPNSSDHIEHPGKNRGIFIKGIKEIKMLTGDGLTESMRISGKIGKKKKIMFFLDGDHSEVSVKRELKGIVTNRPDAAILVHDTYNQVKLSGYNTGPYLAVSEIIKNNKRYDLFNTNFGLPGMSLLIPKAA